MLPLDREGGATDVGDGGATTLELYKLFAYTIHNDKLNYKALVN